MWEPARPAAAADREHGRVRPRPAEALLALDYVAGAWPGGRRALAANVCEWTGGSRDWPERSETKPGEVLVYVARGGVEVDLDGEVHALEEGDALLFDGGVPHRLRRTGGTATRALCVGAHAAG